MALHHVRPVTVRTTIAADPDEVFAYVANTLNDPTWCPNVDSANQVAGDGVAVGSRFQFRQHLDRGRGKRVEFDADVEVVELGERRIVWSVSDRFQERTIELWVEPDAGGSVIAQTTSAAFRKPPGILRWVYPIMAKRTFRQQFAELRKQF